MHDKLTRQHALPPDDIIALFCQFHDMVKQYAKTESLLCIFIPKSRQLIICQTCISAVFDPLAGTEEIEVRMVDLVKQTGNKLLDILGLIHRLYNVVVYVDITLILSMSRLFAFTERLKLFSYRGYANSGLDRIAFSSSMISIHVSMIFPANCR